MGQTFHWPATPPPAAGTTALLEVGQKDMAPDTRAERPGKVPNRAVVYRCANQLNSPCQCVAQWALGGVTAPFSSLSCSRHVRCGRKQGAVFPKGHTTRKFLPSHCCLCGAGSFTSNCSAATVHLDASVQVWSLRDIPNCVHRMAPHPLMLHQQASLGLESLHACDHSVVLINKVCPPPSLEVEVQHCGAAEISGMSSPPDQYRR